MGCWGYRLAVLYEAKSITPAAAAVLGRWKSVVQRESWSGQAAICA